MKKSAVLGTKLDLIRTRGYIIKNDFQIHNQHFNAVILICNMPMFLGILIFGFIRGQAHFISPTRPLFLDYKTPFKFQCVLYWPRNPPQHVVM